MTQSPGMGETIPGLWRKLMCRLGLHKSLDVIESFGAGQHIGCPYCGREFGIHHGMQVVVPWTGEFDEKRWLRPR